MIAQISNILSLLTILAQIVSVILVVVLFTKQRAVTSFAARHAMKGMMLVALIAMLGSLFYSDVAGYEPCKLCWFQRIFMYPQTILMALAIAWRTSVIANACGILSSIGAFIAGYHYLLQLGLVKGVGCGAIGYSVSCSQRFVMNYGYITIPLMAFSAFFLIMILAIIRHRTQS